MFSFPSSKTIRGCLRLLAAFLLLFSAAGVHAQHDPEKLFQRAQQLTQQKKYSQAIDVYKTLTSLQPSLEPAWYNLGVLCLQTNNSSGARWAFRQVYRLNPKNDVAVRALMQLADEADDFDAMKTYARALMSLKPGDASPHLALGIRAMKSKDYSSAEDLFAKAARVEPKNAGAWINLGLARTNQEKFKTAREAFAKAAALQPKDPAAKMMLAGAAERAGDLEGASSAYQSVLRLQPENVQARLSYASILDRVKKSDRALEQYRKVAAAQPQNFIAQFNIGRLSFMTNDYRSAEQAFGFAVKANPKSGLALSNLALAKLYNNKIEESEKLYKQAIALDPKNAAAYEGLSYVYEQQGKLPEAIAQLEKAQDADPSKNDELSERIAGLYERQGKFEEASTIWSARAEKLKTADAWRQVGRVNRAGSRYAEAAEAYRSASDLEPGATADMLAEAQMWSLAKNIDKAIAAVDRAKKADAESLEPYTVAAGVYSEGEQMDKAVAEYDAALSIDPNNSQLYIGKAKVLEEQEKYPEAIEEYRKLEANGEQDTRTLSNIGRLLEKAGKPDDAIAEYRRLAEKFPEDASIQMTLGAALDKKEDLAGALTAYKEAVRLNAEMPGALSSLGAAQRKQGQTDEAKQTYIRLAEMAPAASDALAALEEIYGEDGKAEYLQLLDRLIGQTPKLGTPPYERFVDEYAEAGRSADAAARLAEVRKQNPGSAEAALWQAKALRLGEQSKEAVRVLSEVLEGRWNDPRLNKEIGLAYADVPNLERAQAHLKRSVEAFPFAADAQVALARVYEKQGNKDQAVVVYREALKFAAGDIRREADEALVRLDPAHKPQAPQPAVELEAEQDGAAVHEAAPATGTAVVQPSTLPPLAPEEETDAPPPASDTPPTDRPQPVRPDSHGVERPPEPVAPDSAGNQ